MLKRLYVHNYRCLVNFEFQPAQLQLVLGLNGSGKSAAFQALDALRRAAALGEPLPFNPWTRTRWLSEAQQRFEIDVERADGTFRYGLTVSEAGTPARPRVESETLSFCDQPLFSFDGTQMRLFHPGRNVPLVNIASDGQRSGIFTLSASSAHLRWFQSWLTGILYVRINPWAMQPRSESESRRPEADFSNLADWYRHLTQENPMAVAQTLATIRNALPTFLDLAASDVGGNMRYLIARFAEPGGRQFVLGLDELSEGQRAVIALYLATCNLGEGGVLVIDEPENFIALAEIQPWLFELRDSIESVRGQALIASHHPELMNQLASDAWIFSRDDGGPTRLSRFPQTARGVEPAEVVARGWEGG